MSKIPIGRGPHGTAAFDLGLLLRSRLLIQANSGGGKSYLLRRLAEQLYGKVQVILVDREGEFASLREKFGFVLVGQGGDVAADVRSAGRLAEKLLELKASAVCDLFEAFRSRPMDRRAWLRNFLNGLLDAPRSLWRDLVVIVDEAHIFAPQEVPKAASMVDREIISGCKDAMISLATVGRKRGYAAVWATQRLAKVDKDATAELLNRLVGPTIEDVDVDRAVDLMSVSKDDRSEFRKALKDLEPGHFFALGRAISKERILVSIGPVQTTHPEPGAQERASEPPPAPEKIRPLLQKLGDIPKEAEAKAKTEAELRAEIRDLRARLSKAERGSAKPIQVPTKPETRIVERAVVPADKLLRVERAMAMADRVAGRIQDSVGSLRGFVDAIRGEVKKVESRQRLPEPAAKPPPVMPTPKSRRPPEPVQEAPRSYDGEGNGEAMTPAKRRILVALIRFEASGKPEPCLEWVAPMAKTTHRSSAYRNNLGSLRSGGYLEYGPGTVRLTPKGRKIEMEIPDGALPFTEDEALSACYDALTPAQRRILSAVNAAWPEAISRAEAAEKAETTETSSAYRNNLGAIRSAKMIEYVGAHALQKAAWIAMEDTVRA